VTYGRLVDAEAEHLGAGEISSACRESRGSRVGDAQPEVKNVQDAREKLARKFA
jgi:hypothetical protein